MGGYITDLPRAVDKSFIDFPHKTDETMIYINIVGIYNYELEEALDCMYMDSRRDFELISIKRDRQYIGACLVMKPKEVRKEETTKE